MITFSDLGLKPEILEAIQEMGFENPTPVQEKTIPFLLSTNKDLVALAQTGTGKTAAFGLPILNDIDLKSKKVQALVLSPTRELAMQIAKDFTAYSKKTKGFKAISIYGGADAGAQIRELERGGQVVVGTPGRVLDLLKRKKLKLSDVQTLVLDEADEMLTMGFKDDLNDILDKTPSSKRTLLFSATMPKEIISIAKKYMSDHEEISVGAKNKGAENVNHIYYMVNAKDRYSALKRIADINPDIYGIVFCRTRRETKEVAEKLMNDGYNADALHGDLSQAQRDYVMTRFRNKNLQILVATDVAARGLDVNNLSHIINYNLPDELESYIHRSGRTGRAGKKGTSIIIVHSRELRKIKSLEKKVGKTIHKHDIPGGKEICEKQLYKLVDKVNNIQVEDEQIEEYLPKIYEKLENLSREDLIKHFVSVEFNSFLEYYKNAKDLNIGGGDREDKKSRKDRNSGVEFTRFYINVGTKNGINAATLIGLINDKTRNPRATIGRIDVMKGFSFFEYEAKLEDEVLKGFENAEEKGLKLLVEITKSKPIEKDDRGSRFGGNHSNSNKGRKRSDSRSSSDRSQKRRRRR